MLRQGGWSNHCAREAWQPHHGALSPVELGGLALKCTVRLRGARLGHQEARDPKAVIQAEEKLELKFTAW